LKTKDAIMAFSQSEKIKSGLIWISQVLGLIAGLPASEKQGAEKTVRALLDMLFHEIRLAGSLTHDGSWKDIEKNLDQAVVMINSGVAGESVVHITQALSQVTSIGHRSMSFLKDEGLL
jgi:hypothetical protein